MPSKITEAEIDGHKVKIHPELGIGRHFQHAPKTDAETGAAKTPAPKVAKRVKADAAAAILAAPPDSAVAEAVAPVENVSP